MTAVADLLARIAALHPQDRRWLLAHLSGQARERLRLALENDTALDLGVAVNREALKPSELIASAAPDHVARALQTQPTWLCSVLLRMHQWPWSAALSTRMPFIQRQLPWDGQPALMMKPALAAAILRSFARSLTLIEAATAAPNARAAPFESLLQRFRRSRAALESKL